MNKPLRIGIFGGSFDPIHNTHCEIARAARDQASLDTVYFVVAPRPPHKSGGPMANAEDRFAMVQAAIEGQTGMMASHVEIDREGLSYTVDTLRTFHAQQPDATLFLILGLDSLIDLPLWKEPDTILALAHILAVPRPGSTYPLPASLASHYDLLQFNETYLSSTHVRERILAGKDWENLVPSGVRRIITEKAIYHVHHGHSTR